MYLEYEDMSYGYLDLVEQILKHGRRRSPRGQSTLEVPNLTVRLLNPRRSHPAGIGRAYGEAIAAAESACLVGGTADPLLMISVGSNFKRFLDGGQLHGAYGPRVRGQMPEVARRLEQDHDTRQAIATIWDPVHDQAGWVPRDLPCTLSFGFAIYDDRLEMSTTMRSNDVWWGVAHDFPMFTALQLSLANALGLDVGPYTHHAYSLHFYDKRDAAEVEKLHQPDDVIADSPGGFSLLNGDVPSGSAAARWELVADRARSVLVGRELDAPDFSELWYERVLRPHVEAAQQTRSRLASSPTFVPTLP